MPGTPFERDKNGPRVESETELIQTYLAPLAEDVPGAFGLRDDAAVIPHAPGTDRDSAADHRRIAPERPDVAAATDRVG